MRMITFRDGRVMHSHLTDREVLKRLNRLNKLIILVEQNDCPEAQSIYNKATNTYKNNKNFTGIIRLSTAEKDWLSYKLECEFNSEEDVECIAFYCNR